MRLRFVVAAICILLITSVARADVTLPQLLSDGMVLQQGRPINIWGKADPGEKITATFRGEAATAIASTEGSWKLRLGPLSAGGPYSLTISGKNTITIRDVLVGEVWVCSGQSNMGFTVKGSLDAAQAIASGDDPYIRLFTVARTVASKPQDDVQGQWMTARPETVADFSAVCYFFGRSLHKALNEPVGLIHSSWGGTTAQTWMSRRALESDPELAPIAESSKNIWKVVDNYQQQLDQWSREAKQADAEGRPIVSPPASPFETGSLWAIRPSSLWNGMVAPLTNETIAGVVWYQGEANAGRPVQYRKLFPALIRGWRDAWGQGDFPFLFVQLPNLANLDPQNNWNWPLLQEAQLKTLSVPKTGMAVTIDLGDVGSLHPRNKEPVGYRLALAAQAIAYGRDISYSGPLYDHMEIEADTARLRFRYSNGGLEAKSSSPRNLLMGFEIAGDDRKFAFADAEIQGETVVLKSSAVARPVAVRYCFHWAQECNLYNRAGLPASPFRTDNWSVDQEDVK